MKRVTIGLVLVVVAGSVQTSFAKDNSVKSEIKWESVDPAARTRLWEFTPKGDVGYLGITPSNLLVAGSEAELDALDPETGEVVWTNESVKRAIWFGSIPNTEYAIAMGVNQYQIRTLHEGVKTIMENVIHVLETSSGRELWDSRALGLKTVAGKFRLPGRGRLMLYGRDTSDVYHMVAADLTTGQILWDKLDFFDGQQPQVFNSTDCDWTIDGHQQPIFDTDSTMLVYMDRGGLRKFNVTTGDQMWVTDFNSNSVPVVSSDYAPIGISEDGQRLWVPCGNSLYAVSTIDGSVFWKADAKIKGRVQQFELTPQGLLVRGGEYDKNRWFKKGSLSLLSPETGVEIWNNGKSKIESGSDFVILGDSVLMFSRKKLLSFDLATGGCTELAKDLKLKGKFDPFEVVRTDDGYRISARQEILLLNGDGIATKQTHVKEPGTSGFLKVASFVATMAIAMAVQVPVYSGGGYTTYMYPIVSFKFPKYGMTTNCDKSIYMVANVECGSLDGTSETGVRRKGPGVVKVDKQTGDVVAAVVTGDKTPVYEADEANSRIYYVNDDNVLVAEMF